MAGPTYRRVRKFARLLVVSLFSAMASFRGSRIWRRTSFLGVPHSPAAMSPLELDTCFLSLDMRPCPRNLASGHRLSCDFLFSGCDRRRRERGLVWPGASTSRVSPTFSPCGYIVEQLDSRAFLHAFLVNQDLDALETRSDDEPADVEYLDAVEARHDETTAVDEEPTDKTKATNVIAPGVKP